MSYDYDVFFLKNCWAFFRQSRICHERTANPAAYRVADYIEIWNFFPTARTCCETWKQAAATTTYRCMYSINIIASHPIHPSAKQYSKRFFRKISTRTRNIWPSATALLRESRLLVYHHGVSPTLFRHIVRVSVSLNEYTAVCILYW